MVLKLNHDMRPDSTPEETARMRFVSAFRSFILNDLAADMRSAYDKRAARAYARSNGAAPRTSGEAYRAMLGDPAFEVYTACRIYAQRMVWDSVRPGVEREAERLEALEATLPELGSLTLDPDFVAPRNVSALDVHLMPGSYTGDENSSPLMPGAVYDRGLAIFSMGLMGKNLDDIGLSMSNYIKARYPEFAPRAILDLGCTIGHNTLPWKTAYPDATVHGIDASGPCLRYAHARARLQGKEVHFRQMNAEALDFPDASMDLVFSSMFLHEISLKTIGKVMEEAHRVLRPGGLMLHMELPPNSQMGPFEGFYLDWDSYYNEEPFYKTFRDQDPRELCAKAGFPPENYFQFVVPSIGIYGEDAVREAARSDSVKVNDETTGRLARGVKWFGFGAWK